MRARTSMTAAAAAAALGAALVLTGCSSDDGKPSADKTDTAGGKGAASAPAESGGGDSGGSGGGDGGKTKAADVEGAWTATTDNKPLSLAVTQGKAALMAEGAACTGELADHGSLMLSLKCADGSKKRTMGTVAVANDELTVVWEGGVKDVFSKVTGATTLPKELKDKLKDLPQYTGQGS
ncbi:hypothetical protein ACWDR0_03820 [Streptomyces sp. NPDC003691]